MIMVSMIVEVTSNNGESMDPIHIADIDDLTMYLDTFIGKGSSFPCELELLDEDGESCGTTNVLWAVTKAGAGSWRTVSAA